MDEEKMEAMTAALVVPSRGARRRLDEYLREEFATLPQAMHAPISWLADVVCTGPSPEAVACELAGLFKEMVEERANCPDCRD